MSVIHLLKRLAFGLIVLWVERLDYLLQVSEVLRVLGLSRGLYMSQSINFRNPYIHNFNIIGDLWF